MRGMISRRRFLAGAVTGATLLVVPRDVLGPTGLASATPPAPAKGPATGIDAPLVSATNASQGFAGPHPKRIAGGSAITLARRYDVVVESIRYRAQMGTVYRPDVSAAHPVVYFLHGGFWEGGSRHQYDHEAQTWAECGWVAVTLDYSLATGYRVMVQDVWAGVGHVEGQWYADGARQVLFGDSAGGHLAALVAVQHPDHFAGQILWSPVISPWNAFHDGRALLIPATSRLSRTAQVVAAGNWRSADPSLQVSPRTPALWIAGSSREFVSFARQGQLLVKAIGARRGEVHLVKGDRHGKSLEQGPLLRSARAWARQQIQ